jgi:hypothetical protein
MQNSKKQDITYIEVSRTDTKEITTINLISPMHREDASKLALEIRKSNNVRDVKFYTNTGSFI